MKAFKSMIKTTFPGAGRHLALRLATAALVLIGVHVHAAPQSYPIDLAAPPKPISAKWRGS